MSGVNKIAQTKCQDSVTFPSTNIWWRRNDRNRFIILFIWINQKYDQIKNTTQKSCSAEINATRFRPWSVEKSTFKRYFGSKWIQIIPKLQRHIHDKNVSLFPTAVVEFKMSRLTLPQRKFLIVFIMKHDASKDFVGFNLIKLLAVSQRRTCRPPPFRNDPIFFYCKWCAMFWIERECE